MHVNAYFIWEITWRGESILIECIIVQRSRNSHAGCDAYSLNLYAIMLFAHQWRFAVKYGNFVAYESPVSSSRRSYVCVTGFIATRRRHVGTHYKKGERGIYLCFVSPFCELFLVAPIAII